MGLVATSGSATPRAQANSAPAPQAASYARFAFGGNAAEIPAEFIGDLIFLPLRVNESQPCLFLFDPTAESSSIDPGRAAELGIPSAQSVALELPGVTLLLPALPQFPKPNFAAHVGRAYEGTLGKDFLESVVVEIDYARKTVRLYDPAVYQYSDRGTSFHLAFAGAMPVVQAKFSVTSGKVLEAGFGVNPALDVSVLISDHYEAGRPFSSHLKTIPAVDPAGGENTVLGRLQMFQIGPIPVQDSIAEFSRENPVLNGGVRLAGEIGAGMLRRYIMVFDYPHQQIIFNPNREIRSDETEDMSGIALIAKGPGLKTFEVTHVRPHTPGADAGIQKGDVIAGIDQDPAADLSLMEIRDLFRRPAHPYKLMIERNGRTLSLTMKLRRLL
ncbi:MAG: PDZ domain-containing protein [Candidatus Acidiferrales bacterium]